MSKGGLHSWRRLIEADVRERKLQLARARALVARSEQLEATLRAERTRRDEQERRDRAAGELPGFARERMATLLEGAIERAAEKAEKARLQEARTQDALREAFRRVRAVERVIERRESRAHEAGLRGEQKELDEIAARLPGATVQEIGR
ncbi:MAG: hypothetical protein FJ293_10055 [Planctomycetes bacterium]|nr:hypothetical protein [Planctomycetota bacterium]